MSGLQNSAMRSATSLAIDDVLDTGDLRCPLPVLKAAARLKTMTPGQCLRVVCRDSAAIIDFEVFCHHTPHELRQSYEQEDGVYVIDINCGAKVRDPA
ncbi:MAG: sulfurtransferase TusA family protein [Pseudomonadota bacterium]